MRGLAERHGLPVARVWGRTAAGARRRVAALREADALRLVALCRRPPAGRGRRGTSTESAARAPESRVDAEAGATPACGAPEPHEAVAGAVEPPDGEDAPRLGWQSLPLPGDYRPATVEHDPCTDWARAVSEGRIPAGPLVVAAANRHLGDLARAAAPDSGLWWDIAACERFRTFAGRLRHWEGSFAGEPFRLLPWQEFVCGNLFGWRMRRTGDDPADPSSWRRRFRRAYLEASKGSGKSPLLAAIGLYGLVADGERGAQVLFGAAKKDQAQIAFTHAAKMARESGLMDPSRVGDDWLRPSGVEPVYRLSHPASDSRSLPLARDSGKSDSGIMASVALVDEVHEHPDGKLIAMLQRSFKSRRQPLLVMATNSGYADVPSVALEEHEAAERLLVGDGVSETAFAFVCGLDEADDPWTDEACWPKANPALGEVVDPDTIREEVEHCALNPAHRESVERLHFCRWPGKASGAWMSGALWSSIEVERPSGGDDISLLRGLDAVAAVDLSESGDMTAISYAAVVDRTDAGEPVVGLVTRSYLPALNIRERSHRDRAPYDRWSERGELRLVPGGAIDNGAIADDLEADAQALRLRALAFDRWRFDRLYAELLSRELGEGIVFVDHPQGWSPRKGGVLLMPRSVGDLRRLIATGRLRAVVNAPLRSAAANAKLLTSESGAARFAKRSSAGRIDALVAGTMAVGALLRGLELGWEALSPAPEPTAAERRALAAERLYGGDTWRQTLDAFR